MMVKSIFEIVMIEASKALRLLVEKALYVKRLTPDLEKQINNELTRMGHISEIDYEVLELLMDEMDQGRIQAVANP